MEKENNTSRVPVPLTKGQHETIKKAADQYGLGIAAYMRVAALEKALK